MSNRIVPWEELRSVDLESGSVYCSGAGPGLTNEALSRLLGVGNTGGFRWRGKSDEASFVVLTSTGKEAQWPDSREGRILRYFGDNRGRRGSNLFATRGGNRILQRNFQLAYGSSADRIQTQIFLYFTRANTLGWRFEGIALPGAAGLEFESALKVVRETNLETTTTYENYLATFTLVRPNRVERKEIDSWDQREVNQLIAPQEWQLWVENAGWWPSNSI